MKYHPEYFDFSVLRHYNDLVEIGILVSGIYVLIFLVSYVYNRVK